MNLQNLHNCIATILLAGNEDLHQNIVRGCKIYIKHSSSQARTPVTGTAPSAAISPMNNLGVGLFK